MDYVALSKRTKISSLPNLPSMLDQIFDNPLKSLPIT